MKSNSNCIDIGCHTGKILDKMVELAPKGCHWGFEPIPYLYEKLTKKYSNSTTVVLPYALSDSEGPSTFKHVINSPGYSGFKKRTYHIPFPKIEEIIVKKIKLDTVIPEKIKIDFIKIDVEGAELEVLVGSEQIITRNKPIIIFEHGIGAAIHYGTKPENVFSFLSDCGMKISTMKGWLNNTVHLKKDDFQTQFYKDLNYYFIAYP